MKKWTMRLALLLAMVCCFPVAMAEQEAAESAGDNGGSQAVSYAPGEIAFGLLSQALGAENGRLLVAEVRGAGMPLELEMPDLILRLGAGLTQQGARMELGLRESQENVGFDAAMDVDAQGISIKSDLLPGERYTMGWETLLGMDLTGMGELSGALETQLAQVATATGALEPLLEPYIEIVNSFMQELIIEEYYDVPEEYGAAPMAYEIYIFCTHAQAAELLTRLAEQLEGDAQLTSVLDALLASQGLSSPDLVEMMRDAAAPLAQSGGSYALAAGTNHDMAAKPWFVNVTNIHAEGVTDGYYLGLVENDVEENALYFNLGYSQTLADGSLGDGADLMVGIFREGQDPRATDWAAELTVTEGETETGKLQISSDNDAVTTAEGLPGYKNAVYVGVGLPEIFMEYEHEMNRFMTTNGGEALTLKATLCPDTAQKAETYAFTLEAGVAPGLDGLQGEGRLMVGTADMPELTGLSFELYEAEPLQLGGESTTVALDALSEEQMDALGERILAALTQCLEAMPPQQAAE